MATDTGRTRGGWSFETLERRLDVRRRAHRDAAAARPPADATEPGQVEREITQAVAAVRADLRAGAQSAARAAGRAAAQVSASTGDAGGAGPGGPLATAGLAVELIEGRFRAEISDLATRAERAAADLESFRRRHGLHRDANYPRSRVFAVGLLIAAAAFEAVFSAALFDRDVEGGLLAAAAVAAGLGAANVSLGFLSGFLGLRYVAVRRGWTRVGGLAVLTATVLLAAGLNFYAARWREQIHREGEALATASLNAKAETARAACLDRIADDPEAAADDRVWSRLEAACLRRHPSPTGGGDSDEAALLSLRAPEAVVLLVLGAGVWAFAALKGYSGVDDPYPDYGKLDRAAQSAREALAAAREDARDALEAPVAEAQAAIAERLETMREALVAAQRAYDAAGEALGRLEAEERALNETEAGLIGLYRRENAQRRDGPPPAYFTAIAPLAPPPPDPLAEAGAQMLAARTRMVEAEAGAADALRGLAELIRDAAQRLRLDPA